MRKTATKLCGYGGTNIPVVGKITVKCEFCDAEEFHKTEAKQKSNHRNNMTKQKIKITIKQMEEMNQK